MVNKFVVGLSFLGIFLLVSGLIYFSPPFQDRKLLYDTLEDFSSVFENNFCGETEFRFINNDLSYSPSLRCFFDSKYVLEERVKEYSALLEEKGWLCVEDSIEGDLEYFRKYAKDGLVLNIHFHSSSDGWEDTSFVLYINERFNENGFCRKVEMVAKGSDDILRQENTWSSNRSYVLEFVDASNKTI